jgi:integrase
VTWLQSYERETEVTSPRHAFSALRAALAQAVTWGKIDRNPAIGVELPKKKAVKPPVSLTLPEIKLVILIVFASMRVGEALALRWNDILSDRIVIDERLRRGSADRVDRQ